MTQCLDLIQSCQQWGVELAFNSRAQIVLSVCIVSGEVYHPLEYKGMRVKHGSFFIPVVLCRDKRSVRAYSALSTHIVVWAPIVVDRGPTVLGQLEFIYKGHK